MKRDDVDVSAPRARSIMSMVIPVGSVASVAVSTILLGVSFGRRDDKLDNVVDAVREIKTEMYRRSDAEVLNVKLGDLDRRVSILEGVRQHHVDVITTRVEKQEDDLLIRASRWIAGGKK
jgi:hypothetical protein